MNRVAVVVVLGVVAGIFGGCSSSTTPRQQVTSDTQNLFPVTTTITAPVTTTTTVTTTAVPALTAYDNEVVNFCQAADEVNKDVIMITDGAIVSDSQQSIDGQNFRDTATIVGGQWQEETDTALTWIGEDMPPEQVFPAMAQIMSQCTSAENDMP